MHLSNVKNGWVGPGSRVSEEFLNIQCIKVQRAQYYTKYNHQPQVQMWATEGRRTKSCGGFEFIQIQTGLHCFHNGQI